MWLQIALCLLLGMLFIARRDRVPDLDRPTPGLNRLYLWTRRLGIGGTFYAALNLLLEFYGALRTSDWTDWKRNWPFWLLFAMGSFAMWFGLSQQPPHSKRSDSYRED